MPSQEILDQLVHVYYECDERGAVFAFGSDDQGNTLKIKFSDVPNEVVKNNKVVNVYYGSVLVNNVNPATQEKIPNENGLKVVRALEQSNAFVKGRIRYVLSPEEARIAAKEKRQEENLDRIKQNLEEGLFKIDLETLEGEKLWSLCEQVGVKYTSATGKKISAHALRFNLAKVLGIEYETQLPNLGKKIGTSRTTAEVSDESGKSLVNRRKRKTKED